MPSTKRPHKCSSLCWFSPLIGISSLTVDYTFRNSVPVSGRRNVLLWIGFLNYCAANLCKMLKVMDRNTYDSYSTNCHQNESIRSPGAFDLEILFKNSNRVILFIILTNGSYAWLVADCICKCECDCDCNFGCMCERLYLRCMCVRPFVGKQTECQNLRKFQHHSTIYTVCVTYTVRVHFHVIVMGTKCSWFCNYLHK